MEKQIEDALSKILFSFYEKLEDLAYNKHEITAADIIDFSKEYSKKATLRANGIIDSFTEAYQTLVDEYEDLIVSKYRMSSTVERNKVDEAIAKLNKNFEKLLKIIRAKAMVALEDIEDNSIPFERVEVLKQIKDVTFKDIMDSLVSGKYLFGIK